MLILKVFFYIPTFSVDIKTMLKKSNIFFYYAKYNMYNHRLFYSTLAKNKQTGPEHIRKTGLFYV